MKIYLNPGHDLCKDPGAVNKELNITEAKIVAEIGGKVKSILENIGYTVKLRQDDNLNSICREANEWGADLFVSIHCNSFTSPTANGTETFYYSNSYNSKNLALDLQNQMLGEFGLTDRGIKANSSFAVIRLTSMPSVLVETAFISNPMEAVLLKNDTQRFANAIARGITDYICRTV